MCGLSVPGLPCRVRTSGWSGYPSYSSVVKGEDGRSRTVGVGFPWRRDGGTPFVLLRLFDGCRRGDRHPSSSQPPCPRAPEHPGTFDDPVVTRYLCGNFHSLPNEFHFLRTPARCTALWSNYTYVHATCTYPGTCVYVCTREWWKGLVDGRVRGHTTGFRRMLVPGSL